jgi:regulation of enolase protein 1 (concanavalin A-like superfamily)
MPLSDLVMKLLAKKPEGRPVSAKELVKEFQFVEKQIQSAKHGDANAPLVVNDVTAPKPTTKPAKEKENFETAVVAMPEPPAPKPRHEGKKRRRRSKKSIVPWLATGIGALVALAIVVGAYFLFWDTPSSGTVRVVINDADIKAAIDKEDFNIRGTDKHEISLRPGDHTLRVKRGDQELETEKFALGKGEVVTVKVELLPGKMQVTQGNKVIGTRNLPPDRLVDVTPPVRPSDKIGDGPIGPVAKSWGDAVDPDGDCQFMGKGSNVVIQVPGTVHDLQGGGKTNGPRLLQEVDSDFVAQVRVASVMRSEIGIKIPGLNGGAFRSGGLLVWQDSRNFIRLERVSWENGGKINSVCWLEPYQDGVSAVDAQSKKPIYGHIEVPDKITDLRLERRQNRFITSYSQDGGQTWQPNPNGPFALNLAPRLKVGVSVVNNTTKPLAVEFADWQLTHLSSSRPPDPVSARILPGWGEAIDPNKNCQISADGAKLTIEVPSGLHDLWHNQTNMARVVQNVEGDFLVEVTVRGVTPPTPGQYHAGTLFIQKDDRTLVHLQCGCGNNNGKPDHTCHLATEWDGKDFLPKGASKPAFFWFGGALPQGHGRLRLERRQGKIHPSYSEDDGKTWKKHPYGVFPMDLPDKVKVGVGAINNSGAPLRVEFDDLLIKPVGKGAK